MNAPAFRLVVPLLALAGLAGCSLAPSPEIVWLGGDEGGAKLTTCPVADCEPIVALARTGLDRTHPGHGPIVLERLGEPACGPTANTLCTYGGPLGIASRWAVVFDLDDGSTRIATVLCFDPALDPGGAVAWNDQRCLTP